VYNSYYAKAGQHKNIKRKFTNANTNHTKQLQPIRPAVELVNTVNLLSLCMQMQFATQNVK